jgi:hypothetical protein
MDKRVLIISSSGRFLKELSEDLSHFAFLLPLRFSEVHQKHGGRHWMAKGVSIDHILFSLQGWTVFWQHELPTFLSRLVKLS